MGTKGRLGLFLAVLSAVTWTSPAPAQEFRRGDADGDGRVSVQDAVYIIMPPWFGHHFRCEDAADADDNGAINITDGVRILNVIFLGIGVLPAGCGPDLTDNGLDCADYPPALCAEPPPPAPLDPRIELRIDAPGAIRGARGTVEFAEVLVQLCNETPVEYWSLGVSAEGCEIVTATTDGTVAAPVGQGGLLNAGFAKSEVIDPVRNGEKKGAVSAIVLGIMTPTELPVTGIGASCAPHDVLRLRVSALVPEGCCGSCLLAFTDGLIGSGRPVENAVGRATNPPSVARPSLTWAMISVEEGTQPFRRGDAGADGETTISDAIRILDFLFSGDTVLACKAAADVDDSGEIDITDPIRLLGFLFLGDSEIPAPAEACGVDPTEDGLGCQAPTCP